MLLLSMEFLWGFALGILIGTTIFSGTVSLIGRYIFCRWAKGKRKMPSEMPSEDEAETTSQDAEKVEDDGDSDDDDISSVISRVRKTQSEKKGGDMSTLMEDLRELSSGLIRNIPTCSSENPENDLVKLISDLPRITDEIRSNPTMQNMYSIVNNIGQGGSFSEEDFRKMQEGMTDMVSSILGGDITSQEIEEQQSDSKIILDRLRKIENNDIVDVAEDEISGDG